MKKIIKYQGDLDENERQVLRHHLDVGERDTPLVFIGRQDILSHLTSQLDALKRYDGLGDKSFTTVIQGAPGAGKTALLNEFKARVESTTTVISVPGKSLNDDNRFIAVVLDRLGGDIDTLSKTISHKTTEGIRSVADLTHACESDRASQFDTMKLRTPWQLIEAGMGPRDKTLVLCIDEAQAISSYPNEDQNSIAHDLHTLDTGNLKILPVFAGLLDTEVKLGKAGLSRLNGISHQLGGFSKPEAKEVATKVLCHDSLGMAEVFADGDLDYITSTIVVASDLWPRHLHYYVKGVLNEVLTDQESDSPRHHINLERVLDYGHNARIDYYKQRVNQFNDYRFELVLIDQALKHKEGSGIPISDLESSMLEKYDIKSGLFDVIFKEAVHTGLLLPAGHRERRFTTDFPIPSMRTFFECECDPVKTLEKLRDVRDEDVLDT